MELDSLQILIGFVIFWLGFKLGRWSAITGLAREIVQNIEAAAEEAQAQSREIVIEKHGPSYYAFAEGDEFLAQGKSMLELMQGIKQRFPNRDFTVKKNQQHLTAEESGQLIQAILQVFKQEQPKEQHDQAH